MFGLLTKQEAKAIRDLGVHYAHIKFIADIIAWNQANSPSDTIIHLNMEVHEEVEKFFKNTMQYTTVFTQLPGQMVRLQSISWV